MLKNKEIAQILDISPAAVSLALNNKPGVSDELRRKVVALRNGSMAAEFNTIQQRIQHASQILFIVLKKHGNVITNTPFFMMLQETLYQQTAVEGYGLQVSHFDPRKDLKGFLDSLQVDQYDGVLVLGTEAEAGDIDAILKLGCPTVVLDAWFEGKTVDCVLMDNESGMRQAVRHAWDMGHRRIGYVDSSVPANNFLERYRAYRSELDMLGIPFEGKYVHLVHSTVDGASRDMKAILKKEPELPTIFVCANDLVAMGVMEALNEYRRSVPGDVSVIGFDDMDVSAHLNPPLTSVGFHTRRIAKIAVGTLVQRIKNGGSGRGCARYLVNAELKVRSSVKYLETEKSIK